MTKHNGQEGCGKNGVGCTCNGAQLDRIRRRAFEIYQARKGASGDAMADWLQAEREVKGAPVRLAVMARRG